jgi:hypothetical protein
MWKQQLKISSYTMEEKVFYELKLLLKSTVRKKLKASPEIKDNILIITKDYEETL